LNQVSKQVKNRIKESLVFIILPVAFYFLLSLFSYHPQDPGSFATSDVDKINNLGGVTGAYLADFLLHFMGYFAYFIPLGLLYIGYRLFKERSEDEESWLDTTIKALGFVATLLTGCGLSHLHANTGGMPFSGGGIIGDVVGSSVYSGFGGIGATLILSATFLAGITLFTGLSWIGLADKVGQLTIKFVHWLGEKWEQFSDWRAGRQAKTEREVVRKIDAEIQEKREPIVIKEFEKEVVESKRSSKEKQMNLFHSLPTGKLPPLSLLDNPPKQTFGYTNEELEVLSRQLELKLADYKVKAEVVGVYPGPVITRFEVNPSAGIKASKIMGLAKDLARGLSITSVRIVDVIPGKPYIGIEIPNASREIVYLSEILRSVSFDKSKSALTLALGKSIGGNPVIADIAKMPHLLVAGTTGSGKSVAVNSMIISLLYKASPEQVKMIMVDPKMLELSIYEGIPHLLAPVVTDMKEAANALRWCVAEMERRYKLMAAMGVRNLAGFNKKIQKAIDAGEPIMDPFWDEATAPPGAQQEALKPLPFIVVIIDEFADMMMIVGKKVEELIARLAQKARAAGVHLVLATQRPSVDVITGLIKANIPTRMAFQVSSRIDSRTILDQGGAEMLLGHGDMLYLPPGKAQPDRVHGAFVDDHEVHSVVNYLTSHYEAEYQEGILDNVQITDDGQMLGETGLPEKAEGDLDELYDKAVFVVTESRKASISYVQRRLRVGYNRAATIVEQLEENGVVSAPAHNGAREVLAPPPPSVDNNEF
jgi:S-DNA-T family DNA segregation ATPase FtsK/SpoIIIE